MQISREHIFKQESITITDRAFIFYFFQTFQFADMKTDWHLQKKSPAKTC